MIHHHPVTREEAAEAHGMSCNLTAFHLDKLVESGLLPRYETPPDQPRGRGRAPNVYEVAGDGVAITIPARRYELIADADADADAGDDLLAVLAGLGFEPEALGTHIVLHNCPFHALAARQTALVCGLNYAFLAGLLDGAGHTDLSARLEPRPAACCVELDSHRPVV